jgi:hypothetical protein
MLAMSKYRLVVKIIKEFNLSRSLVHVTRRYLVSYNTCNDQHKNILPAMCAKVGGN